MDVLDQVCFRPDEEDCGSPHPVGQGENAAVRRDEEFLDLGRRPVLIEQSGENRREQVPQVSIGLSFRAQSARIWAGTRIGPSVISGLAESTDTQRFGSGKTEGITLSWLSKLAPNSQSR